MMVKDVRVGLNLPRIEVPVYREGDELFVQDLVRRQRLRLLPEEWVRQNMLRFLVEHKAYPLSLMSVEYPIRYGKLNKRADLLVLGQDHQPLLIGEFKATEVKLTNETFMQLAVYNSVVGAPYLLVSNGLEHYVVKVDFCNNQLTFLSDIPVYSEIAGR